jgi:copper(I)-binding protein
MGGVKSILLASFLGGLFIGSALAGDIVASTPWTRATVRGASVGVGYFTLENKGKEVDSLTGATTDAAERVELHETKMEDGLMKMRALPQGVEIVPGDRIFIKPGSYHLMLVGLKWAFFPGETVHVTLNFAKSAPVAIDMKVEPFGAEKPETKPAAEEPPQISY